MKINKTNIAIMGFSFKFQWLHLINILQIAYGFAYLNADCGCDSFMTLQQWMLVSGFFGFYNFISTNCCCVNEIIVIIDVIILMFTHAWIIVGTILFFGDCFNAEINCIRYLMFASLIAYYFQFVNNTIEGEVAKILNAISTQNRT